MVFEGRQLTYTQINQKANSLAHYLVELGVGTEALVGIFMERSIKMVIGLLGILKAGGVYVPLDPEFPKERIAYTMHHANVSVLLTKQHLAAKLPENKVPFLCIDTQWEEVEKHSDKNTISGCKPTNLTYVIYTSKYKNCAETVYSLVWERDKEALKREKNADGIFPSAYHR